MRNSRNSLFCNLSTVTLAVISIFLITNTSSAFPQFARKFHLKCATCHTMIPGLTPFGYAFLRAGFRLPSNVVQPVTLKNSVALALTALVARTRTVPNIDVAGLDTAFATSLGKQWAVNLRYTTGFRDGSQSGFSDFWAQYNTGARGAFWSLKFGQMPIVDGYQQLGDRSYSITDAMLYGANGPLAGTNGALGDFALGAYETGIQGGYTDGPFSTRLSWLYGIKEDGSTQNIAYDGQGMHDLVLQSDYLIGNQGSAISGFYYNGRRQLQTLGIQDNFQRMGVFGTYSKYLEPASRGIPKLQLELNGGLLYGVDNVAAGKMVSSYGTIIESDLFFNHQTAISLRYDTARSAGITGTPDTDAYTLSFTHQPAQNILLEVEYRKQNNPGSDSLTGMVEFLY